nr:hypothetical protein [Tanacetum cinerariifolium]
MSSAYETFDQSRLRGIILLILGGLAWWFSIAFYSRRSREKLSGNNFNDRFRQLKLVLSIEQPLPAAPAADSDAQVLAEWNALYDAYNKVACFMLGSMTPELHSNGIYEIDMHDLVPNINSIYNVSTKRAKHNLDSTYLWHCRLAHISKKHIKKLQQKGLLKSTDDESFDQCVSCLSGKMTRKSFLNRPERAIDLLEIIHTNVCGLLRHVSRQGYLKETMGYYFYFPPENKIVVVRYAEFFGKNLITQEVNGRAIDLEEIQDEDASPSKITSEISMEVEGFEPPQEEVIPIRRSKRLIGLGQNAYMDKILKRYKMDNSKRGHIPMQERLDLNKTQGASTPKEVTFIFGIEIYRERSKRLIGLGQNAYMDKILKRYKMDNSKRGHIPMQERLDLNKTQGASTPKEVKLDCKSSKQSTTTMSATEYIAASEAVMEVVWIRKFISGLGIVPTINDPIRMFYDNSAALHFANKPRVQRGARHYHRRYHYVRENIALGEIRFLKVHTDYNLANPFTKALSKGKLLNMLGA